MEKIFGAGVTAEHRQKQSLLDLFYCRHAGLILCITGPGMFTLGSWTQIILHFWSCLKLDTWSHLWSKAAGFCSCFELWKEERVFVLHWASCMGVLLAFMAIFSHQEKVIPNIVWAWQLRGVLVVLPWAVWAFSYTTARCCQLKWKRKAERSQMCGPLATGLMILVPHLFCSCLSVPW